MLCDHLKLLKDEGDLKYTLKHMCPRWTCVEGGARSIEQWHLSGFQEEWQTDTDMYDSTLSLHSSSH